MNKILSLLVLLFLLSCASPSKDPAGKEDTAANCYRHTTKTQDTITLNLVTVGDSVTGTLEYNFKGDKRQVGTLSGYTKNDIVIADYSFMSGGVENRRPVAFKKTGDDYIEGSGPVKIFTAGQLQFASPDSLNYNPRMVYKKFDCNEQ